MGGLGSGRHWRWGAKDTTDEYLRLDIRRLARDGLLEPGNAFGWRWTRNGERTGEIRVRVEASAVRLAYRSRQRGMDWQSLDYRVSLTSQPCHFGGSRVWFNCPAQGCGRKVAVLYGGTVFACRHCYDLAYPSQREKPHERHARRADAIRQRLGWEAEVEDCLARKPKGMHQRTFERLHAELEYWEDRSNDTFTEYLVQLLASFDSR